MTTTKQYELTCEEFALLDKVSVKQAPLEQMTGFELVKFYHAFRKMVNSYPFALIGTNQSDIRLLERQKEYAAQDEMRRS